jgi:desulfoferrodoxin (superoxide reductase-like protein)
MRKTTFISTSTGVILLCAFMFFGLNPAPSYADAPQDVKIAYDAATQTLTVTITHKSAFVGVHHIKNVEIKKNGATVSNNNYNTQPKEVPFSYTYKVEAVPGDTLEATATCNLSGSLSASMTVPKTK